MIELSKNEKKKRFRIGYVLGKDGKEFFLDETWEFCFTIVVISILLIVYIFFGDAF